MKLIECYIEGFGKLANKKIDFTSGLNCINEDNGSGKTTLATFIKVMLYGMSDTKKSSLEENDRKHYLPWNGTNAGGSLTFTTGAKTYRVERTFAPKAADDTFALYDVTLGKRSRDFTERLGEELFGIDADGFERTVFLSERALTPKSDNKSISAKLSNLVGCNGDIGDMDDALKALESERKFYYKKGGSGELADMKAKISDITAKLDELDKTDEILLDAQAKLLRLNLRSKEIKAEISALSREREAAAVRVAKSGYGIHLKDMQNSLNASIKRKDELLQKFGGRAPTFEEIDEASFKSVEAKSLLSSEGASAETTEYLGLKSYFDGKVMPEDIEDIKNTLSKRKENESKRQTPEYVRLSAMFSKRIPDDNEILDMLNTAENKNAKAPVFPILSALVAVLGVVLGFIHPALFALIAVSAVLLTVGVAIAAKQKKADVEKISDFLTSLSDKPLPDKNNFILVLRDINNQVPRARDLLLDNSDDFEKKIKDFEAKFPGEPITDILRKYERFATLSLAEQYKSSDRTEKIARARRLIQENTVFLARFNVGGEDPFAELRRDLTEYNMLSGEILKKRSEIENFGALHSLGEDAEGIATMTLEEIEEKRHRLESESAELAREIALTDRACAAYADALEERDELVMKRLELEELLKKQEENYNIILLTKKYLTEARENMTVRYLGKTKSSFEHYAKEIGGGNEEFIMSTDFGVSKLDGGVTKDTEAYSRGTRDLYNLAARLALVDSLYEGEKPFIVLDDPFCSFDDKKTAAALKLLKASAKERQIIYFTCSKSREA